MLAFSNLPNPSFAKEGLVLLHPLRRIRKKENVVFPLFKEGRRSKDFLNCREKVETEIWSSKARTFKWQGENRDGDLSSEAGIKKWKVDAC